MKIKKSIVFSSFVILSAVFLVLTGLPQQALALSEDPTSSTGLILDWRLNETSGTTITDSSASSNDGTLSNFDDTSGQDVVAGSGWTEVNKKLGTGALMVDGVDDYAISDSNIAISGNSARTLEFWLYLNDTTPDTILGWGSGGGGGYFYPKIFSGQFFLWHFGTDWYTGITPTASEWQHHAITQSGTTTTWHINGEVAASRTHTLTTGAGPMEINRGGIVNGTLDAIRVYTRALDLNEIQANYLNGFSQETDQSGLEVNIADVIALDCGADVDFGTVTPGTPVSAETTCTTTTNSENGYTLDVKRDDADTTMDHTTDDAANITDKTAWTGTGGTTDTWTGTGLGFAVYASSTGSKNNVDWGAGTACHDALNEYTGFPTTYQSILSHSSYASAGTTTSVCYRVDIPSSQKSGSYDGTITYQVYTNP